jgi:hypothetical protein
LSAFRQRRQRTRRSARLGTQLGVGIEAEEDRRLAKVLQTTNGILDWIAVPNFLAMRP